MATFITGVQHCPDCSQAHSGSRAFEVRHESSTIRRRRRNEPPTFGSMYDAAWAESLEHGDFAPYWVYPGPAKIERHVFPYPLSKDGARLAQMQNDLALYRLAFGQPRQEDMFELLRRTGS